MAVGVSTHGVLRVGRVTAVKEQATLYGQPVSKENREYYADRIKYIPAIVIQPEPLVHEDWHKAPRKAITTTNQAQVVRL